MAIRVVEAIKSGFNLKPIGECKMNHGPTN
jgi:hypothetical protein